jgi:hypothetical protein
MVVIEASKPKTNEGRIFSGNVTEHAAEVVRDTHYIKQYFFENETSIRLFYSEMRERFKAPPIFKYMGYFPEAVTTWIDGTSTISANEHFISRYKTLKALEGLAKHALSHVDYQLQNISLAPIREYASLEAVDSHFPVRALTIDEKYELWIECGKMEEEDAVVKRAIELDSSSAMAEDSEIYDIAFNTLSENFRHMIQRGAKVGKIPSNLRKDFFFLTTRNYHIGKDAAFLTTPNQEVQEYRRKQNRIAAENDDRFFSMLKSEFSVQNEAIESFRFNVVKLKSELDELLVEINPQTREDFARFVTTFLNKE